MEMIEEYLEDKYLNKNTIQFIRDITRKDNRIVVAAYIETYLQDRERKYY